MFLDISINPDFLDKTNYWELETLSLNEMVQGSRDVKEGLWDSARGKNRSDMQRNRAMPHNEDRLTKGKVVLCLF